MTEAIEIGSGILTFIGLYGAGAGLGVAYKRSHDPKRPPRLHSLWAKRLGQRRMTFEN